MRVIASQKLPRDSGESIFAARHQDASQGPLGKVLHKPCPLWGVRRVLIARNSPKSKEGKKIRVPLTNKQQPEGPLKQPPHDHAL